MIRMLYQKRAQSLIEYMGFVVVLLVAFIVFQKYIARGIAGRWKTAGDSMAHGRLYEPKAARCANDVFNDRGNVWFNMDCFEADCSDDCLFQENGPALSCASCIDGCQGSCNFP